VAHNNQTGQGRTLQRAAGQWQQWTRLSHLLWQQRQWQNAMRPAGLGSAICRAIRRRPSIGKNLVKISLLDHKIL
jgi:hypothetical protein